ncbi:acyltransferase family protein [Maribellus comscasis]|uniref:Acyltransferase family protein n=1 Tax=Maribellus comscasis TaxID=2681766 RepID=A0A6I6JXY1_9BACT|nr:acyltransferase family protein [Maribellus comscasis]QGY43993.1 acyltransferase family protein [Maribellus comscasis]
MKTRVYFLDNLRTFLILLVVILHAGMTYEQGFDAFWIVSDPAKWNPIALVRMYLDLFVMFMMFFISGYFIPGSLKNKNSWEFIKSKIKRIMLPWIIAVFTLIPAYKAIFLFARGLPQEKWFSYFHIFERTGTDLAFFANNPTQNWLWFLPVLFMFQVIYLGLAKTKILKVKVSLKTAVVLTFILGVIYSMVISEAGLKGWTHSPLLDFQNERLLVYFMSFLLGSLCYKLNAFKGTKPNYKIYIASNVTLTISLGVFTLFAINLFYNLIEPGRNHFFISNFADRLVYYASALLAMLSFLQILIHAFRFNLNKTNPVWGELSKNSYAVYIIHMVVLGVVALAMIHLPVHGGIKYVLLSGFTFLLSNMIIYSWRKTRQKSINAKTVITIMAVVFIIGTAFQKTENKPQKADEQPIRVQQPVNQPQMSLHAAVITGNMEMVNYHIKAGSDVNKKEAAGGSSPLITACVFGQTEAALALIKAGADVNQTNNDGSTALHTAAFFCRTEVIEVLLANGVDKSIKNNAGSTAAESVTVPFETVKPIYDYFSKVYEPLGLTLDYEKLKATRPVIAEMLK